MQQEPQFAPGMHAAQRPRLHAGVDQFMASVMGLMSLGLGVTAGVVFLLEQFFLANPDLLLTLFGGPLRWVVRLAPLAFVWFFGSRISELSTNSARITFFAFAALMGVSVSWIPFAYTGVTILSAFGVTAVTFGAMALFGYVTKKDMSGMGRFLFMSIIGLIVAGIASWFIPGLSLIVSAVGVLIFAALTAYDTQRIRQIYLVNGGASNLAVHGALELYLDFINIFLYLLRLFGSRD